MIFDHRKEVETFATELKNEKYSGRFLRNLRYTVLEANK